MLLYIYEGKKRKNKKSKINNNGKWKLERKRTEENEFKRGMC